MLALDAVSVAALQRTDEALSMLVLRPLAKLLPEELSRVTLLFDALDEAELPGTTTALLNEGVRLVSGLHGAGVQIVVTTRPTTQHIVEALQGRWGSAYQGRQPEDYLRNNVLRGAVGMPDTWHEALKAHASSKVYCTVAAELWRRHLPPAPLPPPPASIAAAYEVFFTQAGPLGRGCTRLLQLLMAAREPPSVAQLEALEVRAFLPYLPGWGILFQARRA